MAEGISPIEAAARVAAKSQPSLDPDPVDRAVEDIEAVRHLEMATRLVRVDQEMVSELLDAVDPLGRKGRAFSEEA